MRTLILCGLLLICGCSTQQPQPQPFPQPQQQLPAVPITPTPVVPPQKFEGTYEGTWVTTNIPLNGTMKCDVSDLGDGKWKGKFYGVWHGRNFNYTIDWTGEASNLTGTARIDGANYKWTGQINANQFKGTYTGNRYSGSFDLKK